MIVHCAKSTCFVGSIFARVSGVYYKEWSLGWGKRSNRICRIHWEKRRIKHTQMKEKQCNLLKQFSYDLEMKTREQNRNNKRVETAI